MIDQNDTPRLGSSRGARLVRGVLLVAAAGSCLVSACGGGSSGGGGGSLEAFIAALDRGADARCTCAMIPAQSCAPAKTRLQACVRQAVPMANAASFPSCAADMVNDYNECVRSDASCREGLLIADSCDTELETSRATCQLPPAIETCLSSNGEMGPDPSQIPPNNPTPGNDGTPDGGIPGNEETPGSGTPGDQEPPDDDGPIPGSDEPMTPPTNATCSDECFFAGDDDCDDGRPGSFSDFCPPGTDCSDCDGASGEPSPGDDEPTTPPGDTSCSDECEYADDDACDDGGPGSGIQVCPLGTDCTDCGPR